MSALRFSATHAKTIFFFAMRLVLRVLCISLPFLALCAVIYWFLLTEYDINYYLSVKPPVFLLSAASIICILLVMLALLIKKLFSWSLTIPLILFTKSTATTVFATSKQQIEGYRKMLLLSLTSWLLLTLCFGGLLLAALQFSASLLAPLFIGSIALLLPFIGLFLLLLSITNFCITTISSGSFASLILIFFNDTGSSLPTDLGTEHKLKGFLKTPVLIALLLFLSIAAVLWSVQLIQDIKTVQDVQIIAHRGAAGKAPENTMAAIQQAIDDHTDWIEIDVQESIDGKIMVIHDSDFMKLAGVNLKVWDATYKDTGTIDIGSWFDKNFSTERTPLLSEVLETARGKAKVLIELKYYGHAQELEKRVAKIVEQEDMVEHVAIMSLKLDGIDTFHALRPEWRTGLLTTKTIGNVSSLKVNFMAINMAAAKPTFIKSIHAMQKDIYVWTVNDRLSMFRMIAAGVDGIITDEPELGVAVRKEYLEMSPVERLILRASVFLDKPLPENSYRDNSP